MRLHTLWVQMSAGLSLDLPQGIGIEVGISFRDLQIAVT